MKQNVSSQCVMLTDPEILNAQNQTVKYMLALDPQRFLVSFDEVAGVTPAESTGYQGWERSNGLNFRGHFFGHYLSAVSQAVVSVKDNDIRHQLLNKIRTAVNGLQAVQEMYAQKHPESAGYVSAFREIALDEVEGKLVPENQKENVLVPWYNLHKLLAGLLAITTNLQSVDSVLAERALTIAHKFGIYVYNRMQNLQDPEQMLKTEYGGMNDALYKLFELTGDERILTAATYFDETALFKELADGKDVLPGKHANTTIPKVIGALHRYEIFSDRKMADKYLNTDGKSSLNIYFKAAVNFWQIVVDHHTYVTGGNSQSEHFHEPDQLFHDAVLEDGATTCETCNTYNMLKLSRELFRVIGDKKYLDYYEQTYTNAILGSQNPKTGMTTYFQPMGAGYTKVFNRPFDDFWCCTGTGIENFTKLGDSYYFISKDTLYLNLYFSNSLQLDAKNLRLNEEVNRKSGQIHMAVSKLRVHDSFEMINLKLRNPGWLDKKAMLFVDGIAQDADERAEFWEIDNVGAGTVIDMKMPMSLRIVSAQDNPHYLSFKYGPFVLAGQLGNYQLDADRPNGILVRTSIHDLAAPATLTTDMDWREWKQIFADEAIVDVSSNDSLVKVKLPHINENIAFIPYYQTYQNRYGVYFQWQQAGSDEAKEREQQLQSINEYRMKTVAELDNFDNNNFEFDKQLKQSRSEVSNAKGRRFRIAHRDGWFSYQFSLAKANRDVAFTLTLNIEDAGRSIVVRFDEDPRFDQVLTIDKIHKADEKGFYQETIPVPESLISSKKDIKMSFKGAGGDSARLFGIRLFNR